MSNISPEEEKRIIAELYKKFNVDPIQMQKETREWFEKFYNEPWKIQLDETLQGLQEAMNEFGMCLEEVGAEVIIRGFIEQVIEDKVKQFINICTPDSSHYHCNTMKAAFLKMFPPKDA